VIEADDVVLLVKVIKPSVGAVASSDFVYAPFGSDCSFALRLLSDRMVKMSISM